MALCEGSGLVIAVLSKTGRYLTNNLAQLDRRHSSGLPEGKG